MFLVSGDYLVPNFLKALGFIAPKGFNVDYVMAPKTTQDNVIDTQLTGYGYSEDPKEDLGVRYVKKDLKSTHSFSDDPVPEVNGLSEFPRHVQVTQQEPVNTNNPQQASQQPQTVDTDNIITVKEHTEKSLTFMLKEEFYGFPRNTLIHMEK